MSNELEQKIAAELRAAEASAVPIEPFAARLGEHDIARAYRVQHINSDFAISAGRVFCGRKIGLTADAVQEQLGVDEPDYGALFADMRISSGGSVDASKLIAPRIEAEIALVLETEVTRKYLPLDELAACIAYVTPAMEIVDSRLKDWRIGIVDTIADNGASARFVLGEDRYSLDEQALARCEMKMFRNGELVSSGSGAASLGSPLNALSWLCDILIDHEKPMQSGDLVLTGALGPVVPMMAGDRFEADFSLLSSVSVSVR
ncbi:MAG: fumarylacetoacetate hydrolase family protein [Kiloniellales bacterium]|nr:fumarylacetoacetate hydrolase family protein [Kiloniellales bacterium]